MFYLYNWDYILWGKVVYFQYLVRDPDKVAPDIMVPSANPDKVVCLLFEI